MKSEWFYRKLAENSQSSNESVSEAFGATQTTDPTNRRGAGHASPSKRRRDIGRQLWYEEKQLLEKTAFRDRLPGSPGKGDVVATIPSPILIKIFPGVIMRNLNRNWIDPALRKNGVESGRI